MDKYKILELIEDKSPVEAANVVYNHFMGGAEYKEQICNNFRAIRDEHRDYSPERLRAYVTNSYINRKLVENYTLFVYSWFYDLNEKKKAEFRAQVRKLFLEIFDLIAAEGAQVPQWEIEEATKTLQTAGMLVFPDMQSVIQQLEDLGYTLYAPMGGIQTGRGFHEELNA